MPKHDTYSPLSQMNMRVKLNEAYLDYFNSSITVARWSEHNGLTEKQGLALIELGKDVHNSKHPDA